MIWFDWRVRYVGNKSFVQDVRKCKSIKKKNGCGEKWCTHIPSKCNFVSQIVVLKIAGSSRGEKVCLWPLCYWVKIRKSWIHFCLCQFWKHASPTFRSSPTVCPSTFWSTPTACHLPTFRSILRHCIVYIYYRSDKWRQFVWIYLNAWYQWWFTSSLLYPWVDITE